MHPEDVRQINVSHWNQGLCFRELIYLEILEFHKTSCDGKVLARNFVTEAMTSMDI